MVLVILICSPTTLFIWDLIFTNRCGIDWLGLVMELQIVGLPVPSIGHMIKIRLGLKYAKESLHGSLLVGACRHTCQPAFHFGTMIPSFQTDSCLALPKAPQNDLCTPSSGGMLLTYSEIGSVTQS